jgi:hypothetical protein
MTTDNLTLLLLRVGGSGSDKMHFAFASTNLVAFPFFLRQDYFDYLYDLPCASSPTQTRKTTIRTEQYNPIQLEIDRGSVVFLYLPFLRFLFGEVIK